MHIPCIGRKGREIVFLLDLLIVLKNTKYALWGRRSKPSLLLQSYQLGHQKLKPALAILVMVTIPLEVYTNTNISILIYPVNLT